ncbi:MAG: dihydrodipicolinate synthase family protein [Planctomycetaceae bacterium]|nr:dihydrodipicolinate synthase family protein [Planctomycetaceae bacterium]
MSQPLRLSGLVAATYTPLHADGSVHWERIPQFVEDLIQRKIVGLYVLGSTGEGISLTTTERCDVAAQFVEAADGRIPVIVQVGSECVAASRQLADHAESVGAAGISAVSPVYFKPDSVSTLVETMAEIAGGAPSLPFYYYHIPSITGVALNMVEFLETGAERIPNLAGLKFTSQNLFEFQQCVEWNNQQMEIFWGVDEMLLPGLACGARGAVGSTYNYASSIYHRLLKAFAEGDLQEARRWQACSQLLVKTFLPFGPRAAQKAIMSMIGLDAGPCRWPNRNLTPAQYEQLREQLKSIGFFEWQELTP